jgi:hypothetical protein
LARMVVSESGWREPRARERACSEREGGGFQTHEQTEPVAALGAA